MEPNIGTPSGHEEKISLKDYILKFREWIKYLWRNWLIILIFGLIGGALGLTLAFIKKPTYVAELTFVLEDSKANPLSSYSGIASQFGIDLGATSSGLFTGDNILEFLKSRLMVEKALLSPVGTSGKSQSLADYYIDFTEIRKSWETKPGLKNLGFPLKQSRKDFSLQQDSILNVIYEGLTKNNLVISKLDKKLSFISVECTTKDEIFSKAFTERLVKEATNFYVQTKTQRTKNTVDRLQEKADSIEALLNKRTYSAAASQDLNFNPARSMTGVSTELLTRDKIVLQTMYGEVVKNLELSRMSMAQETPIIQIVDSPILPLKKLKLGKAKGLILGGILGGFLSLLGLMGGRVYREIMQ